MLKGLKPTKAPLRPRIVPVDPRKALELDPLRSGTKAGEPVNAESVFPFPDSSKYRPLVNSYTADHETPGKVRALREAEEHAKSIRAVATSRRGHRPIQKRNKHPLIYILRILTFSERSPCQPQAGQSFGSCPKYCFRSADSAWLGPEQ